MTTENAAENIQTPPLIKTTHPLDDKNVWKLYPSYNPPVGVDIAFWQKEINRIIGTTRDKQPIMKLVWSGDRREWLEYFFEWNALGKPTAPPVRLPYIRYKILRDEQTGERIRDVFPPRWLLMVRLEPEQYADGWEKESYVFAPEIGCNKLIRPETPPKSFWMWYATIAKHTSYCCAQAEKDGEKCFGQYAPPSYAYDVLHNARKTMDATKSNPFARIDASDISFMLSELNGYRQEIAALKVEAQIHIENPYALLGIEASLKAGINTLPEARKIVKEFYDRKIEKAAKKLQRKI